MFRVSKRAHLILPLFFEIFMWCNWIYCVV